MNKHSIKVPRLYKVASEIFRQLKENSATNVKDLVFEAKHPNKKAIYALVLTAIQKDEQINQLLKKTNFMTKENGIKPYLAKILITELLWGKNSLPTNESKPIKTVLAYRQQFIAHSDNSDDVTLYEKKECFKPRFVRVNTLKCTVSEAIDGFRDEGWILKRFLGSNYDEFIAEINGLNESEFMVDLHVPNLLIFPPKTEFYRHDAYKLGQIALQDKASCLPCIFLNAPVGSKVLDMCAAPGMKATQLAAIINDSDKEGIVYAIEKDNKRLEILNKIVEKAGATKFVKTILKDCLMVDSKELPGIEYIIVDPSCSGSGLVDRLEMDPNRNSNIDSRLDKLKGFQVMALKHALRNFPEAKRVVYSTCSLYPQENEEVVLDVISHTYNFKLVPIKDLVTSWKNFGSSEYSVGEYCLYARPDEDLCTGFFVAVFDRVTDPDENIFLIKKPKPKEEIKDEPHDGEGPQIVKKKDKKKRKEEVIAERHDEEEPEVDKIKIEVESHDEEGLEFAKKKDKKKRKQKLIVEQHDEEEPEVEKKKRKKKEKT